MPRFGPSCRCRVATPKNYRHSFKACDNTPTEFSAMLSEHFVASISASTKPNTGITKDAGIFVHEYQPLAAQRHVFKKSATAPNGLAVSRSHIFAAQEGKAVVHVYNREKGNQEVLVPFPERIHSIALASKDSVLLLGTESGRILAWEVCSVPLICNVIFIPIVDLLWSTRLHLYIPPSARKIARGRPDVQLLPLWLPRLYDTCLEPALDPVVLSR